MSSLYVRQTVKQWLAGQAVPFYDTVNLDQDPSDPMWMTVDWGFGNRSIESYCRNTVEEGQFNVAFFGVSGVGEEDLLLAAETLTDALLLRADTTGRLLLIDRDPPMDFRQGEWFGIEISVSYEYRA